MIRTALALVALASLAAGEAAPPWQGETWEKTRVLTWANPGTGGDLAKPEQWLEDGRPATKAPDRDTDIVLPEAPQRYRVAAARQAVRHVTIGRNALLSGGHRAETEIWGNCHVQDGGRIMFFSARGPKHTFVRLDGAILPGLPGAPADEEAFDALKGGGKASRTLISHKFQVCKYGDASVEFIGQFAVSDEIMVQHGRMIIDGRFHWSGGTGKGALEIYDGAVVELRPGALIGPFIGPNSKKVYNLDIYRNGVLQAGSPERPLTGDAVVALGFADNAQPGRTGLYAAVGSAIRVFSADPAQARLVFTSMTSRTDFRDGKGKPVGDPAKGADGRTGITLALAGELPSTGVFFDYVCTGGIRLADPAAAAGWGAAAFGPKCAGPRDGLLAALDVDANVYYHRRGDAKSEYGLTTKAVANMEEYMRRHERFALAFAPENTEIKGGGGIETPIARVFAGGVEVTIASKVAGARIHYTLDGSEPTAESPRYEKPLRLTRSTIVKARGIDAQGMSPVYSAAYVVE